MTHEKFKCFGCNYAIKCPLVKFFYSVIYFRAFYTPEVCAEPAQLAAQHLKHDIVLTPH